MNRFRRLEEIVRRALELDEESRRVFLDAECWDDCDLRLEVERILERMDRCGSGER